MQGKHEGFVIDPVVMHDGIELACTYSCRRNVRLHCSLDNETSTGRVFSLSCPGLHVLLSVRFSASIASISSEGLAYWQPSAAAVSNMPLKQTYILIVSAMLTISALAPSTQAAVKQVCY